MPAELWSDVARMAACCGAVAAVAGPVGFAMRWLSRRMPAPSLRPRRSPYAGYDLAACLFLVMMVVPTVVVVVVDQSGLLTRVYGPDAPVNSTVRGLWVGLLAAPGQFALIYFGYRLHSKKMHRGPARRAWAADVATGIGWWFVLAPSVLIIHGVVNLVHTLLGYAAEDHPLALFAADRAGFERVMFVLQAGVVAPLLEEVVFRGALLGWLVAGRGGATENRVWAALLFAGCLAAITRPTGPAGPVAFAVVLAGGWVIARTRIRKRRLIGGVYASATVFAAVHSSVWPTPIPLFALGLGLGWVAVRTNGILTPFLVHGLFNIVSVLFVLSGAAK